MTSRLTPGPTGYFGRAIADAHDTYGRHAADLEVIPRIGRTTVPSGWLPWLLRNEGLEPLMPYVDWATLWNEGRSWLRIRGTAHASVQALGWIGWGVEFEYGAGGTDLYDHYHLHLDRVPWREELERLIPVEGFAKSTDSVFFRLVHGLDARPVRGGHSRYAHSIWGNFSGVSVRPDWPLLSFQVNDDIVIRSTAKVRTDDTLTDVTFASRRGDIVSAVSRYGTRMGAGPVVGLELSDVTAVLGGARHVVSDMIRPVAGVVGGHSRHGDLQCRFIALQMVLGERPIAGRSRHAEAFVLADVQQLMKVPASIEVGAYVQAEPSVLSFDVLTDFASVQRGERLVLAADAPDGPRHLAAVADFNNAPWSALPWGDEPWGTGPRVLATDKTTEI